MSNNNSTNNNTRNIYNTTAERANNGPSSSDNTEIEMLLNQSERYSLQQMDNGETTIDIEQNAAPISQQDNQRQHHLQQLRRDIGSTRINMEANLQSGSPNENSNTDERQRFRNLFSMLREARQQLNRSHSIREPHPIVSTANSENIITNTHQRTWREDLYNVLASPVAPRTDILRAFFNPASTASVHYNSLSTNGMLPEEQLHFLLNRQNGVQSETDIQLPFRNQEHMSDLATENSTLTSALRISRQNSRSTDERSINENSPTGPQTSAVDLSIENNSAGVSSGGSRRENNNAPSINVGRLTQGQTTGGNIAPTIDMIEDADANAIGEIILKLFAHFVYYLPFIFILFVKFIHDHLLGLLDLLLLHSVVYQINKSLKEQIAKLNQKSYAVLIRNIALVIFVISFRIMLSTSSPDPFGLLINPPGETITLEVSTTQRTDPSYEISSDVLTNYINPYTNLKRQIDEVPSLNTNAMKSTISVTKATSLVSLLYYIAVNDLILKLLTQLIKLVVTMLPTKVIRHKSRARLYALIEYASQFYRAVVPMRQWLTYLFESYVGLEVISGILFSAFYIGAKGFEFIEGGKILKKALVNFVHNIDHNRKPTTDELETAGTVCPICHDSYTTPIVLECGHIFCDECVSTWFKMEQTCPMCRAKVGEDPRWQDGATIYFYQLC